MKRSHAIALGAAVAVALAVGSNAGAIVGQMRAANCHSSNGLPDHRCTPGAVNPEVKQQNIATTICISGWTATIRPPASFTNALKAKQIKAYGFKDTKPADYEEDHLISLELGGAPRSEANLWPEPRYGSHPAAAKDTIENRLHREVCSGVRTLANAQVAIAKDWITA